MAQMSTIFVKMCFVSSYLEKWLLHSLCQSKFRSEFTYLALLKNAYFLLAFYPHRKRISQCKRQRMSLLAILHVCLWPTTGNSFLSPNGTNDKARKWASFHFLSMQYSDYNTSKSCLFLNVYVQCARPHCKCNSCVFPFIPGSYFVHSSYRIFATT